MSKIIVGVDESERSKDAVALAARLARGSEVELLLVCAYPYDTAPSRAANTAYKRYLRDDALATLEGAAGKLAETHSLQLLPVPDVSPPRAIQEIAARERASLIVIGSSHRGAVGRVLAGTTAERLLHGAPCPVAVAPSGYAEAGRGAIATIAVGYDGSPESEAALTGAVVLARSLSARLRVTEVIDTMLVGPPALMTVPGDYLEPDDLEERTREHVAERVGKLPGDIAAEPHVLVGEAESRLAEQSRDIDLFVVGSRGYGPHRAVLLGSVSGRLVRDAACPVLVVPRGIEAPLEELFAAASETQPA
ncbi:MAG TPA: universal stress protein [Solirubrobacteraceae bacterium]|nr:universal stress protein [Solirubrobacteraceae bacterium]